MKKFDAFFLWFIFFSVSFAQSQITLNPLTVLMDTSPRNRDFTITFFSPEHSHIEWDVLLDGSFLTSDDYYNTSSMERWPSANFSASISSGNHTMLILVYGVDGGGNKTLTDQNSFTVTGVLRTINITATNNFPNGTIKVDGSYHDNAPFSFLKANGESTVLGAVPQLGNDGYYKVWNDYMPNLPSQWEKNLVPIQGAYGSYYSFSASSGDNNATYKARMRNNYCITRNDQTEFDGTIGVSDATRIVEQNSGTVPAPSTKTVGSRTYNFAGWANGGSGSFAPTDNMAYPNNAFYKTTHYSNQNSTFMNNNQNKVARTSDDKMHLVYESMGYVFYERSTDNGTTWQLMNNGKPLSTYEAKHPSISFNGNDLVIVYQERDGNGSKIMLYSTINSNSSLLEPAPDETYINRNLVPVIAFGANSEVMVVWKRNVLSGTNQEGLYYKFGHLDYGYYTQYSSGNLIDVVNQSLAETLNPAIDVTKSITFPARNVFHIACQQPTGNYSHINYLKIDVGTNNSLSSTTGVEDVSSGCGYQYNYAPSISLSTSNVVNVAWAAMLYYPTGTRKVMTRTRTTSWSSYFGQYGNSVFSPSVACYGSSSIIAWSETNGSSYSDKFLKWGGVHTANTTGKDLQIYSTTTLQDMRIVSFNGTSSPYSLTQSTDLYTLNKENPLAMRSGVQVVAAQGKTEFYFRIGDISFNGQNVAFKTMNLNEPNLSQKDLDYLMTSDVVNLAEADNLGYSIEYGATDTVKALQLLQKDKFISFNVELIDASNDAVLYTLNDVKFNGNSSLSLNSESYNIDLTGLTGKEVYFKVKITNSLNPVYYASEIKSDAKVLGKSKAVSLDLSNKLVVKDYDLFQNYPNPFNPATTITYQLPKSGSVTLKIYDMLGKEVMTLVNEQKEMGRYTVQFDASSLASGMYVYQLRANDFVSTKKMLLLK